MHKHSFCSASLSIESLEQGSWQLYLPHTLGCNFFLKTGHVLTVVNLSVNNMQDCDNGILIVVCISYLVGQNRQLQ